MVEKLTGVLIKVVMFGLAVAAILLVGSFLIGMGPFGLLAAVAVGIASRVKDERESKS